MAERTQQKPESRRRFALALAGMDDEEAFLGYRLGGYLGVLRSLALFHFLPVAKRFGAGLQFSRRNFDHVRATAAPQSIANNHAGGHLERPLSQGSLPLILI
jgi:hypothetical protein